MRARQTDPLDAIKPSTSEQRRQVLGASFRAHLHPAGEQTAPSQCVTQDVLSSPVSFAHEEKGCTAEVISMEITTSAPDSTEVGWVALGRPWIWPCVHHCHRGKPHPSNKVKHLPEWLR
ncbi:hypothetical protein D4764_09G0007950 [Takifugu flavidus]|uniref:Uncharacterized protein n=1 Tax=Takifugu flavidus TaxID=433684 RepID=A0A5C6MM39_9TELE|nr:hypothetical protein D4764_09G0007950 [Takifugu flavidus]